MKSAKQVHLDLMCSLAHKQQDTIKKLNDQLDKSNTSYNGVLVWKIKVRNLVAVAALINILIKFNSRHFTYNVSTVYRSTMNLICRRITSSYEGQ